MKLHIFYILIALLLSLSAVAIQTNVKSKPFNVSIITRQISFGSIDKCALTDEGVKCWGNNEDGQTNVPEGLKNPTQLSTGALHICALTDEGVKCWGNNRLGQINVPDGLKNPMQISAGALHTCALTDEGVKYWGNNYFGETNVPDGLKNPTQITTGYMHTCALMNSQLSKFIFIHLSFVQLANLS